MRQVWTGYDRGAQFNGNVPANGGIPFNRSAEDSSWAEFDRVAGGPDNHRRPNVPAGRR